MPDESRGCVNPTVSVKADRCVEWTGWTTVSTVDQGGSLARRGIHEQGRGPRSRGAVGVGDVAGERGVVRQAFGRVEPWGTSRGTSSHLCSDVQEESRWVLRWRARSGGATTKSVPGRGRTVRSGQRSLIWAEEFQQVGEKLLLVPLGDSGRSRAQRRGDVPPPRPGCSAFGTAGSCYWQAYTSQSRSRSTPWGFPSRETARFMPRSPCTMTTGIDPPEWRVERRSVWEYRRWRPGSPRTREQRGVGCDRLGAPRRACPRSGRSTCKRGILGGRVAGGGS